MCGCVTSQGGLDLFFTADVYGNVAVTIIEAYAYTEVYRNRSFYPNKAVVSMAVSGHVLYIVYADGRVVAVELSTILSGNIKTASELVKYILFQEEVYPPEIGISCVCTVNGSSYCNLYNKDNDKINTKHIHSNHDDILEGHSLLIGSGVGVGVGGQIDPQVIILTMNKKQRLVQTGVLSGHTSAVTQIAADCAGRYYFTGSSAEDVIMIWDALTLQCERKLTNLSLKSFILGYNCILISSSEIPCLRFYRVFSESTTTAAAAAAAAAADHTTDHTATTTTTTTTYTSDHNNNTNNIEKENFLGYYSDSYLRNLYADYIESTRNIRWCYSKMKSYRHTHRTSKGLGSPPYFEDGSVEVVRRYKNKYNLLGLSSSSSSSPSSVPLAARHQPTSPVDKKIATSISMYGTSSNDSDSELITINTLPPSGEKVNVQDRRESEHVEYQEEKEEEEEEEEEEKVVAQGF